MYLLSPVPGSYQYKFRYGLDDDPLYIKYVATSTLNPDITCKFSITKLSPGCYSLVDFGDSRQKDKHYTTWERAFRGIQCICKRRFSKVGGVA